MTDGAKPFAAKKFLEIKGRRMAYRRGRRRSHRFRAWKPDLILSVAQRHAVGRRFRRGMGVMWDAHASVLPVARCLWGLQLLRRVTSGVRKAM